jgi:hypothetical protein
MADLELLILFNSYFQGNWADDKIQYQINFGLLAVFRKWGVNRLPRQINPSINLIAENIHWINHRLNKGLYFYRHILAEGIVLHDVGTITLA